jgi:hypothetical protein
MTGFKKSERGMLAFALVLLVTVGSGLPGQAKPADVTAKGQSSISVTLYPDPRVGETTIHKVNRTYDVVPGSRPQELLLLDQTVETEGTPSSGSSLSRVALKVSSVSKAGTSPSFTIEDRGTAASRSDDNVLFIVSDFGCCGSNDTHAVYSLKNGRRLFFAGGQNAPDILTLQVGAESRYYVGVHSTGSHRDAEVYGNLVVKREAAVLITLASPTDTKDALLMTFDRPQSAPVRGADVRWSEPGDISSEGRWERVSSERPAILQIGIGGVGQIRIPVKNGQLVLESATIPKGGHLRRVEIPPAGGGSIRK